MESVLQQEREWRPIEGYEGLYEVSNLGEVRRLKKWNGHNGYSDCKRPVIPSDNGHGYLIISLYWRNKRKNCYIHRLVAKAFIDNPNGYEQVNHIDYNTKNNHVSNLEWCTASQNQYHSSIHRHGFRNTKTNTGEKFITYRKSREVYRVIIRMKEYGAFKTFDEAVRKRDQILEELGYAEEFHNLKRA